MRVCVCMCVCVCVVHPIYARLCACTETNGAEQLKKQSLAQNEYINVCMCTTTHTHTHKHTPYMELVAFSPIIELLNQ